MLKKFGSIWVLCLLLVICSVTACNNGQVQPPESGKDGVSIVWKGSFASADEIENPQYLWAYYNTTDGCSYIYDGEKWTLLAGKAPETGAGAGSDTPVLDGFIPEATEVFVVTYQTDYAATPQQFYCMPGYKIPAEKLPQLTETHHDFGGWFDGETSVSNGYVIQKNTTLKAKWSLKKYTITYVCEDFTPPDPVVLEYGTVLDEQYLPDISNINGKEYVWMKDYTGSTCVSIGYVVDDNIILVAEEKKQYDLTLRVIYETGYTRNCIIPDIESGNTFSQICDYICRNPDTYNVYGLVYDPYDVAPIVRKLCHLPNYQLFSIKVNNDVLNLFTDRIKAGTVIDIVIHKSVSDVEVDWGKLYSTFTPDNKVFAEIYKSGITDRADYIYITGYFYVSFVFVNSDNEIFYGDPVVYGKNDNNLVFSCIIDLLPEIYKVYFIANDCLIPVQDYTLVEKVSIEDETYFINDSISEDYYFTITIPETNP